MNRSPTSIPRLADRTASPTGIRVLRGVAAALAATLLLAHLPLGGHASAQAGSTPVSLPPSA